MPSTRNLFYLSALDKETSFLLFTFYKYLLLITFSVVFISGCGGDVRGGAQTIIEDQVDVSGVTLRVNNFSGSNDADGIETPYQSLQFALDQLRPGDTLLIERGAGPYKYLNLDNPQDLIRSKQGFKLSVSGSAELPITIKGEPELKSIIDQEGESIGLFLECVSNVIIQNLEIRNADDAGITTEIHGGCETSNIIIEDNYIHDVSGNNYVGGIRTMGVNNLVIRNNQIENILKENLQGGENRDFVDWGKGISNLIIESNIISSVDVGITINAQGIVDNMLYVEDAESISSIKINDNIFRSLDDGIILKSNISSTTSNDIFNIIKFKNVEFYFNIFDDINNKAIFVDSGDTLFQSEKFCVFNNTLVNSSPSFLDFTGVKNLEIFNNVLDVPNVVVLRTNATVNTELINSVTYSDYNFYSNSSNLTWELDFGGPSYEMFPAFSQWLSASRQDLINSPDINSILSMPVFIDTENDDYRLSSITPTEISGRDDRVIGYSFGLEIDYLSNCRESL